MRLFASILCIDDSGRSTRLSLRHNRLLAIQRLTNHNSVTVVYWALCSGLLAEKTSLSPCPHRVDRFGPLHFAATSDQPHPNLMLGTRLTELAGFVVLRDRPGVSLCCTLLSARSPVWRGRPIGRTVGLSRHLSGTKPSFAQIRVQTCAALINRKRDNGRRAAFNVDWSA